MCGICGIYQAGDKSIPKIKEAIALMNKAQANRGPDGEGFLGGNESNIFFGHRRLAVLDESILGSQPMTSHDGRFAITFSGEIYNFLELKEGLESKGYLFKTKTDTEVLLSLFTEYGEKSFSMLRGMFAFGLWDRNSKKLFLVKDRYGIKPLYYYKDDSKLVFASTVEAIKKSDFIDIEKNSDAQIGFLLFGSIPAPFTTIKNVFALMPGHYLTFDENSKTEIIKYYDPLSFFQNKIEAMHIEAAEHVKNILKESIDLNLVSDVPVGIFLSGGVDSSSIATIATSIKNKPIGTVSIVFDEKDFSEEMYQKLIVDKIKSNHDCKKITKEDFIESLSHIYKSMGEPSIDGVNSWFISRETHKKGLKVALSGLGSDEIFLGYPSFKKAKILQKIQSLPNILKFPIFLISKLSKKYSKLIYLKNTDPIYFYLSIRGLYSPQEISKILNVDVNRVMEFINNLSNIYELQNINLEPEDLLSYLEIKFYLQNQLLKDADFMSMSHGVEVRVPFLDHKLVEYVSSLPVKVKFDGGKSKYLLLEAVKDMLPKEILNRSKMGFTFPFINSRDFAKLVSDSFFKG